MKKVKILFAVALVLACALSLVACNAETVEYPQDASGSWTYSEIEFAMDGSTVENAVCLISYIGSDADVVIPSTIIGEDGKVYNVCSLGDGAFQKYDEDGVYAANEIVKTVSFEEGCLISEIPNRAFYMCSALESIELSNNIKAIGAFSFYGCKALTEVTFPASVRSIGEYAFRECANLKEAYIFSDFEAEEGMLAIPTIGAKCFYMINNKSSEKDRYYLAEDFKIFVADVSAYDSAKLEEFRKQTKNDSYKCWSEYEGHIYSFAD